MHVAARCSEAGRDPGERHVRQLHWAGSDGATQRRAATMVPLTGPKSQWLDQVLFLGTGTSSQVPAIHCITGDETECVTCHDALKPGSKNRRFCTSLVAVGSHPDTPESKSTILIDCGKSFYESALRYFPRYGLRRIDAVLLTHGHADAILGLDDLRSWTMGGCIQGHVDVYLTYECMKTVQQTFPYLIDRSRATGGGDVGALRWHLIDSHRPFFVGPMQVEVTPLPVDHGFYSGGNQPFECLGFRIDSMSYISDCVRRSFLRSIIYLRPHSPGLAAVSWSFSTVL